MRILVAVCAGVVALPAQTELDFLVERALTEARPALLRQMEDAQDGYLALACLAAVVDGVPADHQVFRGAIRRLANARLERTYDLAVRLLVLDAMPEFPRRQGLARRDARLLLRNQVDGGGFGYQRNVGRHWDLSNTQYAALGLRAAESLGYDVPDPVWRGLAGAILAAQSKDGGFSYTPNGGSYPSMTVAGIAVLEVCSHYLPQDDPLVEQIPAQLERAWLWMERNRREIGNPRARWTYYFHYGLERAAALSGKGQVGDTDWFAVGARMLCDQQMDDGGFAQTQMVVNGTPISDLASTAFAILFLRRTFQRFTGPLTQSEFTVLTLPTQCSRLQEAQAIEHTVRLGRPALPDVLKAMRSPYRVRRDAAAQALRRITGKDFGYDPALDPTESNPTIKSAEKWWLSSRLP